ncbi:hypothetical protein SMSK597_1631 [Streptococcus mitis SK597]|uniref:Uncharacterized protein n=1 Tax=Streptococcus mitis SK597 TaxID=585204 RepID=E1LUI5_STRMT|nr:hypothetical protein SMSK597_1631 [Streptococcus mitis SK597]
MIEELSDQQVLADSHKLFELVCLLQNPFLTSISHILVF